MVTIKKFYATWCPSCLLVGPTLETVVASRPGFAIVNLDVDKSGAELQRYNLTGIPAMVCTDENDVEISRFIGNGTEAELSNWLDHTAVAKH